MEPLIYVGKVSLYWTLFYACYLLFLRHQTFFVWNRLYLIGALLISFALPFLIYPESAPKIPLIYEVNVSSGNLIVSSQTEQHSLFTWSNSIWFFYVLGAIFMAYNFVKNIAQLRGFLQEGELIELEDCKVVLINSNDIGSFSFLHWIVVNRNDYENHFDAILRHEMVHMQQKHTIDVLLVELLKVVFWFNPILVLYKKSLQEVHEFLADSAAPNRESYATFLISYALHTPIASLTNHFFKPSQIKSRIQMIYKNRTSKWMLSTYLIAVIFIGTTALFVAGCEQENFEIDDADKITIKGKIVDPENNGISGAIVISGKHTGAITDNDGNYTIQAPPNSTLEISGKDRQSLQVKITNQTSVYATLAPAGHATLKSFAFLNENESLTPEKTKNNEDNKKIFTVVEQQPEFPGGTEAMFAFLGNHIQYPEAAVKANVSGRVFLSFVVSETGETSDIMVLKGLGFGCDAEAIRVLKSFPKWEPGRQDGVPVKVKYNLPINFQLD